MTTRVRGAASGAVIPMGLLMALGIAGCPGPTPTDAGNDARAEASAEGGTEAGVDAGADVETPTESGVDAGPDAIVPMDVPGDGMMGPDPVPSMVNRAVDCGTICRRPLDAVLNAAGTTIYFTAFRQSDGAAAVFTAPAAGGAPTVVVAGGLLNFPGALAISDDDATLYIADLAADGPMTTATGAVLSVTVAGGAIARVNISGTTVSGPTGIAVRGDTLYVGGTLAMGTASLGRGVVSVARAGGASTVLSMSALLSDVSDLATGAGDAVFGFDTGANPGSGRVATISPAPTFGLSALVADWPAGIASSRNGASVLVAGWTRGATHRITYVRTDGTMAEPIASSATIMKQPTGIGRALNAAIYVVADETSGDGTSTSGSVFVVR